jgi:anthranilate synthase component 1
MKEEDLSKFVVEADYVEFPQDLFEKVTVPFGNSMLLESVEIDSKVGTRSVMLVDASLRISCMGNTVFSQALTRNGMNANEQLYDLLKDQISAEKRGNELILTYPDMPENTDEDSRLRAVTVLDCLRTVIKKVKCHQGQDQKLLGGCFAYDLISSIEKLPQTGVSPNDCPDYCFYLAETHIHIDHINQHTTIYGCTFDGSYDDSERIAARLQQIREICNRDERIYRQDPEKIRGKIMTDLDDEHYCQMVEKMKEYINKGDIFQVVPSRTFAVNCPSPSDAYRHLKATNPSPYMFYLNDESFTIFGASPESSVKYTKETNTVEMYPIAGTSPRGKTSEGKIDPDLDGRIELAMRNDRKEVAEHLMLVDLARNDLARICQPGTRYVKDLLKVDRYSHVMHLVSRVVGQLRHDLDAIHAYQACMNMGTLTGAPKIRATELIRQLERRRRGSYGGAIGYLSGNGDMDTCIVIRSAFVKNQTAYVQAGAGVVYDSVPEKEAMETRNKAAAVLNAIAIAHGTTLKELQ